MTKLELIKKISQRTGIERQEVLTVLESMMLNIQNFVAEGETIYLRGFGSFGPKIRAQKTARNISNNTTIIIPEHVAPHLNHQNLLSKKLWKRIINKIRSDMPSGSKRKRHKISTHKRKKRLRKNRHKKKK